MFTCVATVQKVCIAYNNVLKEVLESLKKGLTFSANHFSKMEAILTISTCIATEEKVCIAYHNV